MCRNDSKKKYVNRKQAAQVKHVGALKTKNRSRHIMKIFRTEGLNSVITQGSAGLGSAKRLMQMWGNNILNRFLKSLHNPPLNKVSYA
jgi:hypothetical protein